MRNTRLITVLFTCLLTTLGFAHSAASLAAGPLILATKLEPQCDGATAILTVTLDPVTHSYYKNGLFYHFDAPAVGIKPAVPGNPLQLTIPSSFGAGTTHRLWITTSDKASVPSQPNPGVIASSEYTFTVLACGPIAKGMTWRLVASNNPSGTTSVGCATECNAFKGDTGCTEALPLLCIKKEGPGLPYPKPGTVNNGDKYYRWAGGVVATTGPVVPPSTLSGANALCSQEFGPGWRVAEFHDGWGWGFQAYGGVGDPGKRFWVHINDQPNGTCWK